MKIIEYAGHAVCLDPKKALRVLYRNWKGEFAWRSIFPLPVAPSTDSPFHLNEWSMKAWCLDKDAARDFCLKDMLVIRTAENELSEEQKELLLQIYKRDHEKTYGVK